MCHKEMNDIILHPRWFLIACGILHGLHCNGRSINAKENVKEYLFENGIKNTVISKGNSSHISISHNYHVDPF